MATESTIREVHRCECPDCREHPRGRVAMEHRAINRLLAISNERACRLLAGFLADQFGRGGILRLASITGLDRKTIGRGRCELRDQDSSIAEMRFVSTRVRKPGAGRKRMETKHPGC